MADVTITGEPGGPPRPRPDRAEAWLSRSPARAVGVFALGYAVWQPAAHWLLHLVWGDPLRFQALGTWAGFECAVAGLGAIAGAAWYYSRRLRVGTWLRGWTDWWLPMIAFGAMMSTKNFGRMPLAGWAALVLASAALTGAFFAGAARLVGGRRAAPPAS